jgi:two-component system nitrate/nitrite response regulator NarL
MNPTSHAPVKSLRVIVADDHALYRESIIRTLRAAGETVVAEGADGASALALIRRHRPDVALVDLRMPGLDGIDVVAALARDGPGVPVVLLSAFDDAPLVRAGLQAGAAAYVTKDADREVILSAVRAAVRSSH